MRETLYDYCVRTGERELLAQWNPTRNGGLTPRDLSYGSKRKVWWRCGEGHEWQAVVHTRTGSGSGCPVCAGKQVLPGVNDLASRYPELAAQWHPSKNAPWTPADVLPGSHKKVWWRCEKGHEWQAIVKSRASGCGCPVCAHREILPGDNDLASAHPELARQWHPTRNGTLRPEDVAAGTRRKVWWRCEKGHEWQAAVASRADGAGCPVCAGKKIIPGENDLASSFPDVAAQWHPDKNGALTADSVSPYSNRKVWWVCALGHEYAAAVAARTMHGSGCPYCTGRKVLVGFNDLAALEPKVAAQWHPTLNGALMPEMVTAGSHRKVWWQCPEGHVWKAVIYSRAGPKKCGCPVCAGRIKKQKQERYRSMQAAGKTLAAQPR
ncbi:MAG: zinc-ribbon domain-containing protein [Oscillospiraceae bacterium]